MENTEVGAFVHFPFYLMHDSDVTLTHTHSHPPPPPQNTHKIKGAFRYKKGWTGRGKLSRSQRILLVSLEGRSRNWPSLGRYVINFMLHRFRDCCYSNTMYNRVSLTTISLLSCIDRLFMSFYVIKSVQSVLL